MIQVAGEEPLEISEVDTKPKQTLSPLYLYTTSPVRLGLTLTDTSLDFSEKSLSENQQLQDKLQAPKILSYCF